MTWIQTTLCWYLVLLIIGMVFFPLTKKIFNRFSFDFGYPFAKTLGILLLSYLIFVLGILKILPFSRFSLIFILCLFAIINLYIYTKNKKTVRGLINQTPTIIIEELLFLASLIFWTYVRGQEPSIRSLEKFMDFGFINSILKTQYFPPKDIWYSPLPINYYYFGHLTGALLIKLSNIKASIGYNLILATIFAQGTTQVFSLIINIIRHYDKKITQIKAFVFGILGAYVINLGGNLHTIYLFTKGYPNDNPVPFWTILSKYNPLNYWYPNATRFIPFTIHEFPSYSYVVADLHGHVFDIPFVLLTIAILFLIFVSLRHPEEVKRPKDLSRMRATFLKQVQRFFAPLRMTKQSVGMTRWVVFLGFLTAIHYMTNAFDGPIYILLTIIIIFFMFGFSKTLIINIAILLISFLVFSWPFSAHFTPFVSGIGVNCAPDFLTKMGKLGPFLFEKGNCQISPLWMLFVLWGFFWISFIIFLIVIARSRDPSLSLRASAKQSHNDSSGQAPQSQKEIATLPLVARNDNRRLNNFILILFSFSLFFTLIPEFFYIKDIYPAHFRANTMFKLGYQAFMIMGIASIITFYLLKSFRAKSRNLPLRSLDSLLSLGMTIIWIALSLFITIYPFFSIPSYYGNLKKEVDVDGSSWLINSYLEDKEIIDYLNTNEKGQPTILEAQGDSYTDYERISAFTGLPTVAGWWVHEWLWRGSSDIVGNRIPEVVALYESTDLNKTKDLINKYKIKYVIVSRLEKEKYPNLNEDKFNKIGKLVYRSSNSLGALYQIK